MSLEALLVPGVNVAVCVHDALAVFSRLPVQFVHRLLVLARSDIIVLCHRLLDDEGSLTLFATPVGTTSATGSAITDSTGASSSTTRPSPAATTTTATLTRLRPDG